MNYKAILLRKEAGTYIKIGDKSFKADSTTLEINKTKTIPIKLDIAFKIKNTGIIFIDMDTETQLSFKEFSSGVDAEDIDVIVTKKFLTSLLAKIRQGTEMVDKSHILMYLLILGAGIAIGFMVGVLCYPLVVPMPITPTPTPTPPMV